MNQKLLTLLETKIFSEVSYFYGSGEGRIFGAGLLPKDSLSLAYAAGNTLWETHDPTAHAEVNVIRMACADLQTDNLTDYILLATHEPCPLCLSAAVWAGIKEIYYLFSYEETASLFDMQTDLIMSVEVFDRPHCRKQNKLFSMCQLTQPAEDVNRVKQQYVELFNARL